jgi:nucleoside-diphosphate-sugar epimerase
VSVALVTGANGFIGSHLCEALVAKGWEVHALVRRNSNLRWLKTIPVKLYVGEVTEPQSLADAVSGADYVFHCAAIVKARNPGRFTLVNVEGTRNVLEACAQHARALKKFLLFSSISALGPDDHSKGPVSQYGASKLAAEAVVAEFAGRLPVAILRLPPVYGPRDSGGLELFQTLNFGLRPVIEMCMSVCYVSDAVEAGISLALAPGGDAQPYSACDGAVVKFTRWAEAVEKALGRKTVKVRIPLWLLRTVAWGSEMLSTDMPVLNRDKVRELSCRAWTCDLKALQARTGFVPNYDLERGLRLTIDWYREHKWLR